jgi:hypothetical protein
VKESRRDQSALPMRGSDSHLIGASSSAAFAEPKCLRVLFESSSKSILSSLSEEQCVVLIALAVWPWSLYKLGM